MIDIGKELQDAFDDGYRKRDAEIVRCKDCKYSKYKQGELRCYIWSISSKTKEDGYCFCGARMEIEENERKRANETNTTI